MAKMFSFVVIFRHLGFVFVEKDLGARRLSTHVEAWSLLNFKIPVCALDGPKIVPLFLIRQLIK